ncbi:hypothetical protein BKA80DRAFT_264781 [Phyllosticta citrichinensis]
MMMMMTTPLSFLALLLATLAALVAAQATNGTLEANGTATNMTNSTWATQPLPLTADEKCGPENGNWTCLIDGVFPCCSAEGFCGGTTNDCGEGCQAGFGKCALPSSYTLGNPACSWSSQGTSPRCDGQCGVDKNNARCDAGLGPDALAEFGVFKYGPCCSKYGFCGNTSKHCEIIQGCQSGCTGGDPSSSSSAAAATVTVMASASTANSSATGASNAMGVPYSSSGFVVMMGLVWATTRL